MDAEPERRVAILLAVDDELVGPVEELGVAVGGRERKQHPVVLLHRAAVEVDVLGDHAGHRDRGVEPQELLDREVGRVEVGDEALQIIRMLRQVPDRRTDRRPRGVDPGDEQQHDHAAHHLGVELLAVELDVEEEADQVVARVLDVVADLFVEIVVEGVRFVADLARIAGDHFEDLVHELAEDVAVFAGKAEHLPDHSDRHVLHILHGGVDDRRAGLDLAHFVEQGVAQVAHFVFEGLDLLRCEGGQQETAGDLVEWRVAGDRGRHTDRCRQGQVAGAGVADDDGAAGEVVGVVGDFVDGLVRDRDPHSAIPVAVGDRATGLAQFGPDLGGDRVVVGAGVIEVGRPIGDRAVVGGVVGNTFPGVGAHGRWADDRNPTPGRFRVVAQIGVGVNRVGHHSPFDRRRTLAAQRESRVYTVDNGRPYAPRRWMELQFGTP